MRFFGTAAALLAASAAHAQQVLINDLSFGVAGRLSPAGMKDQIPNFVITGSAKQPQVLSNKLILTPVNPGNFRGSIWSEKTLDETEWVTDIDMRANGPERGGGNLNIWLAKDGDKSISSNSIYTVGKFEGLALVIDAHDGSGGMLRAFLNDGSTDYSARSSVDELAFGHCLYPYRNLGRPSQVKLRQSRTSFSVEIDGRECFSSNKVSLPPGYKFGITAATPETPDSFEIFKLVVMSDKLIGGGSDYYSRHREPPKRDNNADNEDGFDEGPNDEDADIFQTSKAQFQDLHNRLQSTNHQLSSVYRSVSRLHQVDAEHHKQLKALLVDMQTDLSNLKQVDDLTSRIQSLEREIRGMRSDLGKQMRENERSVKGYLSDHHATLSQTMLDSVPGHGKLIAIFILTQVVLAVAYVVYKTRKANSPKKFL